MATAKNGKNGNGLKKFAAGISKDVSEGKKMLAGVKLPAGKKTKK